MNMDGFTLDVAEILVGIGAILISAVISLIALRVSNRESREIAKEFGDLAGQQAAIKYEEQKAAGARITALRALLNETILIRTFVDRNGNLVFKHDNAIYYPQRIPITAFETAFFSGTSSLLDGKSTESSELLSSVTDYLTEAHSINRLIDFYSVLVPELSSEAMGFRHDILTQVRSKSQGLSEILDQLEERLKRKWQIALEEYSKMEKTFL